MDKPFPKVVACLPSYNAEAFITKTIECLKNQTYSNFSVLISDDCSTDNTVSVIKSTIEGDERFTLLQQEKNLGWVDNINFLMKKAVNRGKYVFIIPHDDQIKPEYVKKLTLVLEQNPKAVLAFSDMKLTHVGGKTEIIRYDKVHGIHDRIERTKSLLRYQGIWATAWRGMIRSEAVKQIIPLQKNVVGLRDFILDWIWLIKLSLEGEFITVPEVLYSKYYQETSTSVQWEENKWNYISSFFTCSLVLLQRKISFKEQRMYQHILYARIVRWMFIGSTPHLWLIKLKSGFNRLFKIER